MCATSAVLEGTGELIDFFEGSSFCLSAAILYYIEGRMLILAKKSDARSASFASAAQ
jgi:hypothetical protein